jgi:large subunit ribosomal protein L7/L12
VYAIQKKLGVTDEFLSGSMGGGGGQMSGGGAEEAEEKAPEVVKDVFEVKLKAFDPKSKIKIIKEVRAITGLGLKEVGYREGAMQLLFVL